MNESTSLLKSRVRTIKSFLLNLNEMVSNFVLISTVIYNTNIGGFLVVLGFIFFINKLPYIIEMLGDGL